MRSTLRSLRAETYRLLRTRSFWTSVVFLAALSALRVVLGRAALGVEQAQALARGVETSDTSGAGWALWVDGWRTGLSAGTLLLLLFAARTLAADRESGVLRLSITRSCSRSSVVLARVLLGLPLILGVVVVTGLASLAVASGGADFGPLVEQGYEIFSGEELRDELVVAALATLPALCATWAFGLMLSSLFKSPAVAVSAAVTLFLGFDLFKEGLGPSQYLVFAAFAPTFVDSSLMSEMTGIARGFADAGFSASLVRQNWILPWPQTVLFVGVAAWCTSRRPA